MFEQGHCLPTDIYSLVNHHRVAKDLWEKVQLLMQAKAVLMANLCSYGLDVLSEVSFSENTNNDMLNQSVQEMTYSKPSQFVEHPDEDIHSDSNIILYSQYLSETQNAATNKDNLMANESLSAELERYKEQLRNTEIALEKKVKELDNIICKMGQSAQIVHMLTKPQVFYDNNLNQALGFQNPFYLKKAQQIRPILYDGNVTAKETNVISIADSEETLMLEEENFGKCFVLQRELSDEQALHPNTDQSASSPVKIEAPQELSKKNTSVNQIEPSFDQLFELNNLKAELQAKDTTIEKLKTNIKRLNKTSTTNNVKKDIDEIETINIELEHTVMKLIAENEHLETTYKQLYDSIKPSTEKVFVTTALKNDLRKFKGKDIVDNAAQASNATTIGPGMYKLDLVTLAPKDKNNRKTHIYYLKHTMEHAAILRVIVE
ncbi:hypothetical protein Tco_1098530 [Tanacetum coccineum]